MCLLACSVDLDLEVPTLPWTPIPTLTLALFVAAERGQVRRARGPHQRHLLLRERVRAYFLCLLFIVVTLLWSKK